jgi:formate dehydrogenase subunit gamma
MPSLLSILKSILAPLCLALALSLTAAVPAAAQLSFKPTEQAVQEDKLLNALKGGDKVTGRITIPDQMASSLIQPSGRSWRDFNRSTLPWVGGIAIVGMLAALALFFLVRGRVRVERGFSGATLVRFPSFERFTHWLTATCFIILGLSGLNISFGKSLLLPLIGPNAFSAVSAFGKLAHNYLAFPFMLGIAIMFIVWIKDNVPSRIDMEWIKAGGGLLRNGKHPPAKRFNAGQKGIFWMVIIGGVLMSLSGWYMLFPYQAGDVTSLQVWTVVHAVVAMLFVAGILAHIYIGSLGMEGAFDAMGTGEVDVNWAKEHHSIWAAEEQAKTRAPGGVPPRGVPAE